MSKAFAKTLREQLQRRAGTAKRRRFHPLPYIIAAAGGLSVVKFVPVYLSGAIVLFVILIGVLSSQESALVVQADHATLVAQHSGTVLFATEEVPESPTNRMEIGALEVDLGHEAQQKLEIVAKSRPARRSELAGYRTSTMQAVYNPDWKGEESIEVLSKPDQREELFLNLLAGAAVLFVIAPSAASAALIPLLGAGFAVVRSPKSGKRRIDVRDRTIELVDDEEVRMTIPVQHVVAIRTSRRTTLALRSGELLEVPEWANGPDLANALLNHPRFLTSAV